MNEPITYATIRQRPRIKPTWVRGATKAVRAPWVSAVRVHHHNVTCGVVLILGALVLSVVWARPGRQLTGCPYCARRVAHTKHVPCTVLTVAMASFMSGVQAATAELTKMDRSIKPKPDDHAPATNGVPAAWDVSRGDCTHEGYLHCCDVAAECCPEPCPVQHVRR